MELLNQTALAVVFGRECGKTIFQMDIFQTRRRITGVTLGRQNNIMLAMVYTDGPTDKHIMGSIMKV